MNLSRPFILRPVATSLLMVGLMLAGLVAYEQLPVSALPQVDYPTIQVMTFYPGASPDVMASSVTAPLERQFGQVPGLHADDLEQLVRRLGHHAAVRSQFEHRHCRAGSAGGDQRGCDLPADGSAESAGLQQDQSGRRADSHACADVEGTAAGPGGRSRGHAAGAKDLAAPRRWAGEYRRRPETVGADPGQSDLARVVWNHARGSAHCDRQRQRQRGERELRRQAAGVHDRRQRPVAHGQGLPAADRRVPQRRAGQTFRRRRRDRRRRERQGCRVDEPDAGRDRQRTAPARRQHHRGRRPDQGADAALAGLAACVGEGADSHRSHHHDSRVGVRTCSSS